MIRSRLNAAHGDDVVAIKTQPIGQQEPAPDTAGVFAEPVMAGHAQHPFAAELEIGRTAQDRDIVTRDARLKAKPVPSLGLNLAVCPLHAMQHRMEGMLIVLVLRPNSPQRRLKGIRQHHNCALAGHTHVRFLAARSSGLNPQRFTTDLGFNPLQRRL